MKRVMLESPYAGHVARNVTYARAALTDSFRRGEAPFAAHLLYTQSGVLDDTASDERALGMAAGDAWRLAAELHVFYIDLGWSDGMLLAKELCRGLQLPWEERRLDDFEAVIAPYLYPTRATAEALQAAGYTLRNPPSTLPPAIALDGDVTIDTEVQYYVRKVER
jgi:hypothetical protein